MMATPSGVGLPDEDWSPDGGYSDPFVAIPMVNFRVRLDDPSHAR
jgi:hypothetical protein